MNSPGGPNAKYVTVLCVSLSWFVHPVRSFPRFFNHAPPPNQGRNATSVRRFTRSEVKEKTDNRENWGKDKRWRRFKKTEDLKIVVITEKNLFSSQVPCTSWCLQLLGYFFFFLDLFYDFIPDWVQSWIICFQKQAQNKDIICLN